MAFAPHHGGARSDQGGPNTALLGRTRPRRATTSRQNPRELAPQQGTRRGRGCVGSGRGDTSVQQDPQTGSLGGRPGVERRWERHCVQLLWAARSDPIERSRDRLETVSKKRPRGRGARFTGEPGPASPRSNGAFQHFPDLGAVLAGTHRVLARDSILEPRGASELASLSDPVPTRQSWVFVFSS